MEKYLEIARFTKTQGLNGDLRAQYFCDSPEILQTFKRFHIGLAKSRINVQVRQIRKSFVVMKIENVNTVTEAEIFIGETLYVAREDFPLPKDTWFVADVIGLEVFDVDTGELYGTVEEILQSAPKDVYVVKTPDRKHKLFPSIPEVLIDVDITSRRIKIRPLDGLFDDSNDSDDNPDNPKAEHHNED